LSFSASTYRTATERALPPTWWRQRMAGHVQTPTPVINHDGWWRWWR
jgi:hypothetical protein